MAGHYDIFAKILKFYKKVTEDFCIQRIQAAERLIQKDEIRLMDQCGDQLDLLLVSF